MNELLVGKSALVTAATDGLGLACAIALADAECSVAICGRRKGALARTEAHLRQRTRGSVLAVAANLSNGNEVSQLAEQVIRELSGLDIVVFNSGHPAAGRLDELSDADWYAAFDLLLMSAVRIIRLVVPVMKARGGGDIVFIGSRVAREPAPDLPLSTVMRLGLTGLAKLLATELAPHNIRINVVAPGYFDTSGNRRRIDAVTDAEGLPRVEAEAQLASHIPIGRFGRAEELAALVLFLVTGKGGFLTGTTITMDGGASRSLF